MPPLETTWSQQTFYLFVHKHLAPLLKRHGYKKLGRTWRKRHKDEPRGWGVINLQKLSRGSPDGISFTINLGVWWDDVPCSFGGTPGPTGPSDNNCHVQERLGTLANDGADKWWEINGAQWSTEQTDECLAPIVASLIPALEGRGLAWINDRLTPKAVAAYQRMVLAGTMTQVLSDEHLNA